MKATNVMYNVIATFTFHKYLGRNFSGFAYSVGQMGATQGPFKADSRKLCR